MNRRIKDATYEFPPLTQADINQLRYYDLKLVKKENDGCCIVEGKKLDLMRYADEYLDYDLHPDYLVEDSCNESKAKDSDYSYEVVKKQLDDPDFDNQYLSEKAYNGYTRGEITWEQLKEIREILKTRTIGDSIKTKDEIKAGQVWKHPNGSTATIEGDTKGTGTWYVNYTNVPPEDDEYSGRYGFPNKEALEKQLNSAGWKLVKDSVKTKDEDLANMKVSVGPLFADESQDMEYVKKAKSLGLQIDERMGQSKYYIIKGKASIVAQALNETVESLYELSQGRMSMVNFYDSKSKAKDSYAIKYIGKDVYLSKYNDVVSLHSSDIRKYATEQEAIEGINSICSDWQDLWEIVKVQDSVKTKNDSKVKDEAIVEFHADKVKDKDKINKLIELGAVKEDFGKWVLLSGRMSIFVKALGISESEIRNYAKEDMSKLAVADSKRFTKQELKDLHKLADALKVKDKMGIANLQFLASPNKVDLSKKDITGEISIICQNEDEKWNVKRLLHKNRIPVDYEDGNKIIVLAERVQDSVKTKKDSKIKDAGGIGGVYQSNNGELVFVIWYGTGYSAFTQSGDYYKNCSHLSTEGMKDRIFAYQLTKIKDSGDSVIDSPKSYKVNGKVVKANDEFDAIRKYRNAKKSDIGRK